jgi:hypothetical protein
MPKRASLPLAMLALTFAFVSPARADLTVFFATDGPAPAMAAVAEVASTPAPEPTPASIAPGTEPATPLSVRFVRVGDGSGETATLTLRDESGAPAEGTLDRLSILARPRGVDAPASIEPRDDDFVAPDIRRLHPGLLPLLARLAEHFDGHAIQIVSGYRPGAREGSRHRFGRALDLRVADVDVETVRAFLDGEPYTGVGLYPTSGFVHLDVRSETIRWVDDSGPGQAPHVVRSEVVAHAAEARPIATQPTSPPTSDGDATELDADAIARAMQAADSITLDLSLAP